MVSGKREATIRLRDRIRESEELSDKDRESLLKFSDELDLLSEEYSDHRHEKLLRHATIMAENVGGLTAALTDKEATDRIVRWIHDTYENPETNRDYRVALRMFGRRVLAADEPPESIRWVSAKTPKNYHPVPSRSEMLDWDEDVLPMIEQGSRNARDKALFAVAYEGGFRGGELYDLTVGDVTDHTDGTYIRVDGKTGEREVQLIGDALPYLTAWLEREHPVPDDPQAPLWSKLSEPKRASYQTFLKYFKRAADRAGVTKEVTPTVFRKSNAYYLAKMGANAHLIDDRQGRRRNSPVTARYIARFGRDADSQYRSLYGVEDDEVDPADDPRPVECVRCGEHTPRHKNRCANCRLPFDPLEAYEAGTQAETRVRGVSEDVRSGLRSDSADAEATTVRADWLDLLDEAERDPEVADRLRSVLLGDD